MSEYAEIFRPRLYFLTYFSSTCTPNYVKTGNLYLMHPVNGCCDSKLSEERNWDNGAKLTEFKGMTSLVAWWSELLTTNHEIPGSITGSAVGIFPFRARSP
jgi:hypothetical protein